MRNGGILKTTQKKMTRLVLFLLLTLIPGFYLSDITKVAAALDKKPKGAAACLPCHGGSFDELAAKKAGFKSDSGMVNPHQFIPHNERKAGNVPDCLDCHTAHPNPPKEKIDLSKVNIETCYLSCHHQQNFEKCDNCHKDRKK